MVVALRSETGLQWFANRLPGVAYTGEVHFPGVGILANSSKQATLRKHVSKKSTDITQMQNHCREPLKGQ